MNGSNSNTPKVKTKKKIKLKVKQTSLQIRTKKNKKEFEYMCKQLEKEKIEKKNQLKKLDLVISKCKKKDYPKYVTNPISLKDLLDIIKKQSSNNVINLLDQFPHPGVSKGVSNTDSLVFEALWILIFLFNYDDLRGHNQTRTFMNKLEDLSQEDRSINDILNNTNVNEGSKSGIADIFFEHKDIKSTNTTTDKSKKIENCGNGINMALPACENSEFKDTNKKFIFSAKYYLHEKGVSHYDIQDIFIEAQEKLNNFNIMLLVKDEATLRLRMNRTQKEISKKYYKILDRNDLNVYYKKLKYDLDKTTIESFIKTHSKDKDVTKLKPRFHQQYFIDYSIKQFELGSKKIIWGAVPRSGKSFMIGGLISKLKPKQVVIFLGAVSETNLQFIEMFKDHVDFEDYTKVNVQKDKGFSNIDMTTTGKNIILISQQKAWTKGSDQKLLDILKEPNKLIFFDEIHQGSSIGNAQEVFLNKYVFNKPKLESPFIMVTATFAKPLLRYMSKGGGKTKLIQWRYEDIQLMKDINQPDKLEEMMNSIKDDSLDESDGLIKHDIIKNLISDREKEGKTLEHLSKEYEKYPELVLMCPELEVIEEKETKFKHLFDEKKFIDNDTICNTIFKCSNTKFKNEIAAKEFINYIMINVYDKLLNSRFGFNVFGKPHTQLWFLPTVCSNTKKIIGEEEPESNKIEPIGRLLAKLLMEIPEFKKHFCILVINSQKLPKDPLYSTQKSKGGKIIGYDKLDVKTYEVIDECISTRCVPPNYKGSDGVSGCIMREEACAKSKNKSLIILTGMRLRLGISLPCVDLALHMDPIKSVDTIYQSMFRVLTERKGKTKGYFVDLLSERFINFMYDYEKYTNKGKKNMDIRNKKKKLTEKLFSFNLNGINSNMISDTKMRSIYTSLIQNLSLDSNESFGERLEDTQKTNLTNLLDDINPKEIVNKLFENLKELDMLFAGKEGKSKTKLKLHERNKPKDSGEHADLEEPEDSEEPEEPTPESNHKETEKQKREKYNQVIGYIKDLFSLYILFEQDLLDQEILPRCNEENIKQFIDFLKYEITVDDLKKICTESNNTRIIDCHISYMKTLNLKSTDIELLKKNTATLNMYRHLIIDFFESIPNTLDDFIGFYCTIRDKFMLIKDSLNKQDTKYVPKCGGLEIVGKNEPTLKSNTLNGGGGKDSGIDQNILEIIRNYLTVKDTEKKLFGEVFTPVELVCEMLDTLPNEVWKDPNLKWLDPANGIGNYPIVVYYKLLVGLQNAKQLNKDKIKRDYKLDITKDKDRSKHIINNMLYMVELNPVNVKVCRKIFKMIDSSAKPNISNEDFLHWTSPIKDKFDIIMGNPPYNVNGNNDYYVKFISEVFKKQFLKINGYLLYLIPNRFLIPSSKANKELIKINTIIAKISVNNFNEISTDIGYVLCNNKKYTGKTNIIFNDKIAKFDIRLPTPTQTNKYEIKVIIDHLFSFSKLNFLKKKPLKLNQKYIFINRNYIRYSPLKIKGGDHAFQIDTGDDGRYLYVDDDKYDFFKWYLTESDIIRLITKSFASSKFVPPFIWDNLPKPNKFIKDNNSLYKIFGLIPKKKIISSYIDVLNETNNIQSQLKKTKKINSNENNSNISKLTYTKALIYNSNNSNSNSGNQSKNAPRNNSGNQTKKVNNNSGNQSKKENSNNNSNNQDNIWGSHFKDPKFNIIETLAQGDCFFDSIRLALPSDKKNSKT